MPHIAILAALPGGFTSHAILGVHKSDPKLQIGTIITSFCHLAFSVKPSRKLKDGVDEKLNILQSLLRGPRALHYYDILREH